MFLQTLRYIKPPDTVVTQIDVYTEEKFEDEEDMRERAITRFKHMEGGGELDAALHSLREAEIPSGRIMTGVAKTIQLISSLFDPGVSLCVIIYTIDPIYDKRLNAVLGIIKLK